MRFVSGAPAHGRGFSLIELMVVVSIIGLLALKALPAMASYLLNSKLRESANTVVSMATYARNEAIKRNMTLTYKSDGTTLSVVQTAGTVNTTLRELTMPSPVKTDAFSVRFDSAGRSSPLGTELKTQVTNGGTTACGEDIRCPGVLIEAGGAVSICREGACP